VQQFAEGFRRGDAVPRAEERDEPSGASGVRAPPQLMMSKLRRHVLFLSWLALRIGGRYPAKVEESCGASHVLRNFRNECGSKLASLRVECIFEIPHACVETVSCRFDREFHGISPFLVYNPKNECYPSFCQ
jgi:hypothetical protein